VPGCWQHWPIPILSPMHRLPVAADDGLKRAHQFPEDLPRVSVGFHVLGGRLRPADSSAVSFPPLPVSGGQVRATLAPRQDQWPLFVNGGQRT